MTISSLKGITFTTRISNGDVSYFLIINFIHLIPYNVKIIVSADERYQKGPIARSAASLIQGI